MVRRSLDLQIKQVEARIGAVSRGSEVCRRLMTVQQWSGMFDMVMRMPIIRNSFPMPPREGAVESHRQDRGGSRRRPLRYPGRRGIIR